MTYSGSERRSIVLLMNFWLVPFSLCKKCPHVQWSIPMFQYDKHTVHCVLGSSIRQRTSQWVSLWILWGHHRVHFGTRIRGKLQVFVDWELLLSWSPPISWSVSRIFQASLTWHKKERSSTWDTTRVSFDSCTNRHLSSLPRFKTNLLCQYSRHKFCEISAGCSHAIHRAM